MINDFKNQAMAKIRDMAHYHGNDMTLGEILHATLRKVAIEKGGDISFLLDITDKEIYLGISRAEKEELEEEYFDPKTERKRVLKVRKNGGD